jgi:hypothetical protein
MEREVQRKADAAANDLAAADSHGRGWCRERGCGPKLTKCWSGLEGAPNHYINVLFYHPSYSLLLISFPI